MSTITKGQVLAEPWRFSASCWQYHKGVYEPAIFDGFSPSQYGSFGPQQKRQFDKVRSAEWNKSIEAKAEYRRLVSEAYDKGAITKQTEGLSEDAYFAIARHEEDLAKQALADKAKQERNELSLKKHNQALAVTKREYAKWWVENAPNKVPGFDHVLRAEANIFWRVAHGELGPRFVSQEIADIKWLIHNAKRDATGGCQIHPIIKIQ